VSEREGLFYRSVPEFTQMIVGTEWLVEAADCDAAKLRDESLLRQLVDRVIADLGLKVIDSIWHNFPDAGGITGMAMLAESHLTCHTYPEHGTATFNLYCCRSRPEWDWESNLKPLLDARSVSITRIERGEIKIEGPRSERSILGFRPGGGRE